MAAQMVAGEPVDVLVRAFEQLKVRKSASGRVRIDARLDPELGVPLQRALMRIERELGHDIDPLRDPDVRVRAPEERRADALVTLARRLAGSREHA
jgi:hypothetical protein